MASSARRRSRLPDWYTIPTRTVLPGGPSASQRIAAIVERVRQRASATMRAPRSTASPSCAPSVASSLSHDSPSSVLGQRGQAHVSDEPASKRPRLGALDVASRPVGAAQRPPVTTYFCGEYDAAHLSRNDLAVERALKRRRLELAAAPPVPPPAASKRSLASHEAVAGHSHGPPRQRPRLLPPAGRGLSSSSTVVSGLAVEAARHRSARRRDRAALLEQLSTGG